MPYDTDNRSGITKNASESQKNLANCEIFLFYARLYIKPSQNQKTLQNGQNFPHNFIIAFFSGSLEI